jgi:ribosomal protein L24E
MMMPIRLKVFCALSQGDIQVLMMTAMLPSSFSSRPRLFYTRQKGKVVKKIEEKRVATIIFGFKAGVGIAIISQLSRCYIFCSQQCQSQEQTHKPRRALWFIFNLQIKKSRISYLHNHTIPVIIAYESYLS